MRKNSTRAAGRQTIKEECSAGTAVKIARTPAVSQTGAGGGTAVGNECKE